MTDGRVFVRPRVGGARRRPSVEITDECVGGEESVPLQELPDFLTVEEAAEVLRISRTSAYLLTQRWRFTGGREGLPVTRLGRLLRVPRAAIERLAELPKDAA
ncbi:MAG TPA: helix-turn-helix domain-containing protein [Acidimicrobiales bacterium]|nr:helix-turn-helix domain-containing protein [Acidimicrobiales bacterium]